MEKMLASWPREQAGLKHALLALKSQAEGLPGAVFSFISRPGISHSLRFDLGPRPAERARPVFFLVDVVNDGGSYFLSACFYADEITDPRELGNAVPAGLFDETGYCFDVEEEEAGLIVYLKERLIEAHRAAGRA
jgi:hypothetical protein